MRKLVAGNWKMNGTTASLAELPAIATAAAQAGPHAEVALFPPFTLLAAMAAAADGIAVGGQDCHPAESGAHTGCVSAPMLADAGASLAAGLRAVVCVGETEEVRTAGDAIAHVAGQLDASLPAGPAERLVVAYEPVWAVGTGRTAGAAEIVEMHGVIRAKLLALLGEAGTTVPILYGGSVTGDNAREVMGLVEVDGVLVGGASLTAEAFVPIVAAAG